MEEQGKVRMYDTGPFAEAAEKRVDVEIQRGNKSAVEVCAKSSGSMMTSCRTRRTSRAASGGGAARAAPCPRGPSGRRARSSRPCTP